MKNRKFSLLLLLTFLFSHFALFSQELCNSVFSQLKKNNFSPKTQVLVNNGTNNFPYNIYINFPASKETESNLVLIFQQEQVQNNEKTIIDILNFLRQSAFDFNTTVLFSYGDTQSIGKQGMIYGTEVYSNSINTNQEHTVFLVDFINDKNSVISFSTGYSAPSWLIKNEFDIFLKNGLNKNLPTFYLSQLFSFDFYSDYLLENFYKNDIPAIKLCFKTSEASETKTNVIIDSINRHSETLNKEWDHHFLMIKIFNRYLMLSESMTIRIIIIIVFIWLCYIILLIFINIKQKHYSWQRVQYIWFSLPATFIITYLSFFIGRFIYDLISPRVTDAQAIYTLLGIQIFLSFLAVSVFFLFVLLLNDNFTPTSVDFLITICSFINQSIFILLDISLFPIFMFICILSIFSLTIKNNILHIIVFVLMIIAFIPYAHLVVSFANISALKAYVFSSKYIYLAFTFILYPIFIVNLRILSSFRTKFKKLTYNVHTVSASVLIILITIVLVAAIRPKQLEKNNLKPKYHISEAEPDTISFNYSDKPVFEDIIRTITIKIKGEPVQCDVTLKASNHSPILYSDNAYESISQFSSYFIIPYCPPDNMTFSYGTNQNPCEITISAIIKTEYPDEYKMAIKTVHIGASQ